MKTPDKDILKICKGFCSNKYNTPFDAVKAYQAEYTGNNIDYLTDEDVLDFLIAMGVDDLFTIHNYKHLFKEILIKEFKRGELRLSYIPPFEMSYRYLADLYIRELSLLKIKDGNNWLIDMSDYDSNNIL